MVLSPECPYTFCCTKIVLPLYLLGYISYESTIFYLYVFIIIFTASSIVISLVKVGAVPCLKSGWGSKFGVPLLPSVSPNFLIRSSTGLNLDLNFGTHWVTMGAVCSVSVSICIDPHAKWAGQDQML